MKSMLGNYRKRIRKENANIAQLRREYVSDCSNNAFGKRGHFSKAALSAALARFEKMIKEEGE